MMLIISYSHTGSPSEDAYTVVLSRTLGITFPRVPLVIRI